MGITYKEAAKRLSKTEAQLRRMKDAGLVGWCYEGKSVVFCPADIERLEAAKWTYGKATPEVLAEVEVACLRAAQQRLNDHRPTTRALARDGAARESARSTHTDGLPGERPGPGQYPASTPAGKTQPRPPVLQTADMR